MWLLVPAGAIAKMKHGFLCSLTDKIAPDDRVLLNFFTVIAALHANRLISILGKRTKTYPGETRFGTFQIFHFRFDIPARIKGQRLLVFFIQPLPSGNLYHFPRIFK